MFWNWSNAITVAVIMLLVCIFGPRLLAAAKRFDAENRDRIERDRTDRHDRNAHFRHAFEIAGEQVEDVGEISETDPRTGTPVTTYVFEGERFATRSEAEAARARAIYRIAYAFYDDLPAALTRRRHGGDIGSG